jgi:DnaJ-class molecular chaperone
MSSDLYAALGVSRSATTDEIRSAYKSLSLKHHPDRPTGDEEKFKKIQEAHEVLSDPARRSAYDITGSINGESRGMGPMSGMAAGGIPFSFMSGPFGIPEVHFNMGDMLNGMFGGGATKGKRRAPVGPNKQHEIGIRFVDFYKGRHIKLTFNQARKCKTCSGSGAEQTEPCGPCGGNGVRTALRQIGPGMIAQTQISCEVCGGEGTRAMKVCRGCQGKKLLESEKQLDIHVEPGMRDGQVLPFAGECSDSLEFDRPGDVLLRLQCVEIPEPYEWKEDDLWLTTRITYAESVLGFTTTLSTHPSGTSPTVSWQGGPLLHGAVLRREGLGMPRLGETGTGKGFGALFLKIGVIPPPLVPWSSDDAAKLQSVLGGVAASMSATGDPLTFHGSF